MGEMKKGVSMLANAMQLQCNLWCQRLLRFFYFNFEIDSYEILDLKIRFYKEIKVNFQKNFRSLLQNFLLCEDGSVHCSPPNTGLTGNFCVCVRQNVAKQCKFSIIFDMWTFSWYFTDMLMTCTTKFFINGGSCRLYLFSSATQPRGT